jgi:hypothetical protein
MKAAMEDPYRERVMQAKEIAQQVVDLCVNYACAPNQTTINRLLLSVEHLSDVAEAIEVEQTIKALDA